MNIRNHGAFLLVSMFCLTRAAEEDKNVKAFINDHDLFIMVKNEWKNEERLMHFKLDELKQNEVMQVERQDLLDKKIATFFEEHPDYKNCFVYSSDTIQVEDDTMRMWYIGLPEPYHNTVFIFAMRGEQFKCLAAAVVPNEQSKKWRLSKCMAYWFAQARGLFGRE